MDQDSVLLRPGELPPTAATEQTLYEAAGIITNEYPEYGMALATFIQDEEQFTVRLGGPTIATISAVLGCVAALHESLKLDGDSPFATMPLKKFPGCASQLLKGRSYDSVVNELVSAESDLLDKIQDPTGDEFILGPTNPPLVGPFGMPRLAQAMTAVLHVGADMSRIHDPVPFTVAFALADDEGESWTGYVSGWPVQSAIAVLSLMNALKDFVDQGIDEYPELRGLDKSLLPMVRKVWKTGTIEGVALDALNRLSR